MSDGNQYCGYCGRIRVSASPCSCQDSIERDEPKPVRYNCDKCGQSFLQDGKTTAELLLQDLIHWYRHFSPANPLRLDAIVERAEKCLKVKP